MALANRIDCREHACIHEACVGKKKKENDHVIDALCT